MSRKSQNVKETKRSFSPRQLAIKLDEAVKRDLASVHVDTLPAHLRLWRSRQNSEGLKKFSVSAIDQDRLEAECFARFREVNSHMANHRTPLRVAATRLQTSTPLEEKILLRARALARFVLTDFDEDEWFRACSHGPGSTIGVRFENCSPEAKFTFPISTTAEVAPLFDRYLAHNRVLSAAVERFNSANPLTGRYHVVTGSRATTVEKNVKSRRMIAVEPTANMLLQQGLMRLLYLRLKSVGLDVERLPVEHQKRAQVGSISGREATIDFTSASDCVSIELLRWLLPPKWFGVLDRVRCKSMSVEGTEVALNMFSTMGNAVTFPLETLALWCLGQACLQSQKPGNALFPEWDELKDVTVFGDDCILPTQTAALFIKTAESVGFIVNKEKSFTSDGPGFRESCGGDFLRGYNVRPFYFRAPTSDSASALEPWLYTVLNGVYQKYVVYFGTTSYVYDRNFFRCVFSLFKEHNLKFKVVPPYYPEDSGFRFTSDLQRLASCYSIPFDKVSASAKFGQDQGCYSFRFCRFQYRERFRTDDGLRFALFIAQKASEQTFDTWQGALGLTLEHLSERVDNGYRFTNLTPTPVMEQSLFASKRRIGGYVVARGLSSCWTVPRLYPRA